MKPLLLLALIPVVAACGDEPKCPPVPPPPPPHTMVELLYQWGPSVGGVLCFFAFLWLVSR